MSFATEDKTFRTKTKSFTNRRPYKTDHCRSGRMRVAPDSDATVAKLEDGGEIVIDLILIGEV